MKVIHLITFILFLIISNTTSYVFADTNSDNDSATTSNIKTKTQSAVVVANTDCTDGPCKVVFDTTTKVMNSVNRGDSSEKILAIVSPKFDFQLMTKFAMGNNWKIADKEQKEKLVTLFKQLLTYTYSNAWSKFKDAKITITSTEITSVKDSTSNKQTAVIISQVLLPNSADNQPIKVEYDLANTGSNNAWVAYDIKIVDASLVTTYRNQFNDIIQSSKVDGLIAQLQTKVANLKNKK